MRKIKKIFFVLRNKIKGYPLNCKIHSRKIKNTIFGGKNYVGKNVFLWNCNVGFASYFSTNCSFSMTLFGKYCSIGPNTSLIRGTHPTKQFVSTYPGFFSPMNPVSLECFTDKTSFSEFKYIEKNKKKYSCIIGNDVWIGANALLLEGITIGDGAIIAAGSVVIKSIPPYEIWGGNPAHLIRKRFNDDQIEFLESIQWWNWPLAKIKEKSAYFLDIDKLMLHIDNNDND